MGRKHELRPLADVGPGDVIHCGTFGGRVRSIYRWSAPLTNTYTVDFRRGPRIIMGVQVSFDPNYSKPAYPCAVCGEHRKGYAPIDGRSVTCAGECADALRAEIGAQLDKLNAQKVLVMRRAILNVKAARYQVSA